MKYATTMFVTALLTTTLYGGVGYAQEALGAAESAVFDAGATDTAPEVETAPEAPTDAVEDATSETPENVSVEAPDLGAVKGIYDAAMGGDWRSFVILFLVFIVAVVRWGATKWEALDDLLNGEGDWSGAMLVFGLSLLGAFATAWKADGASLDFALCQAAFENAVLAFGGYSVLWKKLVKPKLGFVS